MSEATMTADGWQLQGNAADAYEAHLVPVIFHAHAERLVEAGKVTAGDRVLDAGCGTGVVTRAAAGRVGPSGALAAVDLNPDMLETARRTTADVRPAVDLRQADLVDLPFEDGAFDVALCQEVVQFLPDRVGALAELRRVVRPGGRLAFCVFRALEHHPVYAIFARLLGEFAGPDAATMMGSPFALSDAETLRGGARDAGWTDIRVTIGIGTERFPSIREFVRWEAASSPLAGPLSDLGDERTEELVVTLERELAPWIDDAGLTFANETHLVTAAR